MQGAKKLEFCGKMRRAMGVPETAVVVPYFFSFFFFLNGCIGVQWSGEGDGGGGRLAGTVAAAFA